MDRFAPDAPRISKFASNVLMYSTWAAIFLALAQLSLYSDHGRLEVRSFCCILSRVFYFWVD